MEAITVPGYGAAHDPAPGRTPGPLRRAWSRLHLSGAATARPPSPPTLETFFDRVGWEADHGLSR